jgi:anaerobic magnesium-protoporphyrin IX monomethyl ester cyclase
MKVHHIPAALRHDPRFVLLRGWRMLLHTFRGSSIRSMLGLESDKKVFERYRAIRRAEREYV